MKKSFFYLFFVLLLLGSSCSTSRHIKRPSSSLRKLSHQLGIPVTPKDNLKLYTEAASWLGVPYRYGGNTRQGVDCSGLVCNIYRNVYGIQLERNSAEMYKKNCRKISRNRLKPGDLIFFNTARKRKTVSHVGIFLKGNVFIHATTASGVRLNTLDDEYYKKRWIGGGKVKNNP